MSREGDSTMHLMLDGRCSNTRLLTDVVALVQFLKDVVRLIGMTMHSEPVVVDYPWPGSSGTALSGVCFLKESSIMVHTYPEHGYIFIDVFSCKAFRVEETKTQLVKWLGMDVRRFVSISRDVS